MTKLEAVTMGGKKITKAQLSRLQRRLRDGLVFLPPLWTALDQLPIDDDLPLDDWVAEIISDQMRKRPRNRSGSFSPSSAGKCLRAQMLAYCGYLGVRPEPSMRWIWHHGSWVHLKYQAIGLQLGTLTHIEHPVIVPQWRAMGSMDGLHVEHGYLVEIKTIGTSVETVEDAFVAVAEVIDGGGSHEDLAPRSASGGWVQHMIWANRVQGQAYLDQAAASATVSHIDRISFVYESKFGQVPTEFVVGHSEHLARQLADQREVLLAAAQARALPPQLPECAAELVDSPIVRTDHDGCGYRHVCADATWTDPELVWTQDGVLVPTDKTDGTVRVEIRP